MPMSRTANTTEAIEAMFVKGQFLNSCPKNFAVRLREREFPNLGDVAASAVRFLMAYDRRFYVTDLNEQQSFSIEGTSPDVLGMSLYLLMFRA